MSSGDFAEFIFGVISISVGFLVLLGLTIALYLYCKSRELKFSQEIGDKEKHTVTFQADRFWGLVKISVDGKQVFSTLKILNGDQTYPICIGEKETHQVSFAHHRPLLYGAFRKWTCEVYVDNKLTKTYES